MRAKLLLAFVLGIAAAAALAACGAKENKALLPSDNAAGLVRKLDALRDDVAAGQCGRVDGRLRDLRNELDRLPSTVSVRLRENLSQGASRLEETAATRCAENRTDTTPVDTTPTATQEAPTTTQQTPTTATTAPETTSTPAPTTSTPTPTVTTPPATSTPSGGAAAPAP